MIIMRCRNAAFNVVASGEYSNRCPCKWLKKTTTDTMRYKRPAVMPLNAR